jgi:hypothetical protein
MVLERYQTEPANENDAGQELSVKMFINQHLGGCHHGLEKSFHKRQPTPAS